MDYHIIKLYIIYNISRIITFRASRGNEKLFENQIKNRYAREIEGKVVEFE